MRIPVFFSIFLFILIACNQQETIFDLKKFEGKPNYEAVESEIIKSRLKQSLSDGQIEDFLSNLTSGDIVQLFNNNLIAIHGQSTNNEIFYEALLVIDVDKNKICLTKTKDDGIGEIIFSDFNKNPKVIDNWLGDREDAAGIYIEEEVDLETEEKIIDIPEELKTIYDYYVHFTELYWFRNNKNCQSYSITKRDSKFYTMSTADYEIEVTIDFKNWYFELGDEGTGGGSVKYVMTMFQDAKKDKYFAFTHEEFDGLGIMHKTGFFTFDGNNWHPAEKPMTDIKITYKDFLDENANIVYTPKLEENFSLRYKLPQHGTSIEVTENLSNIDWKISVGNEFSDKEKMIFREYKEKTKYSIIELKWNKTTGKFEIERKTIKK